LLGVCISGTLLDKSSLSWLQSTCFLRLDDGGECVFESIDSDIMGDRSSEKGSE
jgi:hypothetical protein